MSSTPAARAGRGVLESAFALLSALEQVDGAGVTRLAALCGLPKSTAHRLLEQLSTLGAVERSRGGYRIGARVFQLGHGWQPHPGLRAAARGPMRRLAATTGATVTVSVLRDGRELTVDWVAGDSSTPVPMRRGATWPWYTAAGKVLVAGMRRGDWYAGTPRPTPEDLLTDLPESAPGRRPASVSTPVSNSWPEEAATIRARGVAFDREQVVSGVCCAAVPLYGAPGTPTTPVAALCIITDPSHRLDRLADAARNVGASVSATLKLTGTTAAPVPNPRPRPPS